MTSQKSPKIAEIAPIPILGGSEIPSSYRPISALTYLSKIFEKFCAKDQTIIFPKTTCWVSSSTVCVKNIPFHRPYRLYGILLQNSMIKLYVVQFSLSTISLSFGQSFHTADKTWALRYDVRGSPFKLIRSYLSNRKQYVQVRSKTPHHL